MEGAPLAHLANYPQTYLVKGAGIKEVNGTYSICGVKNDRPFYQKEGAALWYFQGTFLSKPYTGWYISKHMGTSNSSAKDDFYTAYCNHLLPPSHDWVTRGVSSVSMLSGSGIDPPPTVEIKETDDTLTNAVVMYPEQYTISGAGSEDVNGEYILIGTTNEKPCYQAKNGTSLYYFYSSIFPISQYNGWYISKSLNPSQVSAKDDYYSAYAEMPLPPSKGWTTREPGFMPSSGCGKNPPPLVEISCLSKSEKIPMALQSSQVIASSFEQKYLVEGAGSENVNGIYCYSGMFNGKPFYSKQMMTDGEKSPILWYFTATVYPISTFTGWHISSELSSSSLSGASDYYSAYTATPFPPQNNWKTRKPRSLAGGRGKSPAPTVMRVETDEEPNQEMSTDLFNLSAFIKNDFSPYFPGVIRVNHAGSEDVNGIYEYCDWYTGRPYYIQKVDGMDGRTPNSLAFYGMSKKHGWAFSNLSLNPDYCSYIVQQNTMSPPEAGWAVDKGKYPPPCVTICSTVKLVRICIHYQKEIFFVVCPNTSTVSDLMTQIQPRISNSIALFQLSLDERILDPNATLSSYKILHGFHLHLASREILSLVPNKDIHSVLVVGAGPVGLWTSIILKLLAPHCNVTVKEKRTEYKRHHALRIEKQCLRALEQFETLNPLYEVASQFHPRTRTSIVEKELSQLASTVGVTLCYQEHVTKFDALGDYNAVVCCDGARSEARKILSPENEFKVEKTLGSLLQIKFDAIGKVSKASGPLAKFMQNLPATQQFFNVLPANPDPETNTTPITIFSLINTELCDQLSNNKSDTPLVSMEALKKNLASPNHKLSEDIQTILFTVCPDGIVQSSLRISVLPASYYIASQVCGQIESTPIFLLGDAAMGLSLEKGLNFGWEIATAFVQTLLFSHSTEQTMNFFDSYFQMISNKAVAQVQSEYSAYQTLVARASIARAILQKIPFVKTNE